MFHYTEQDDLNKVRKQFKENQEVRRKEAEKLQTDLKAAIRKLGIVRAYLNYKKLWEVADRVGETYDYDGEVEDLDSLAFYDGKNKNLEEVERDYQYTTEWIWRIERRFHELSRQEREDLQWIWKLEDRFPNYRPPAEKSAKQVRQEKRAADWRAKENDNNSEILN